MPVGARALAETSQPTAGDEDEQGRGSRLLRENLNTPETSSVYHRLPSGPTVTSWGNAPVPAVGPTPAGYPLSTGGVATVGVVVDVVVGTPPTWT
jgi:hypothetical protein